jgi:peptidyl-prolyl cis-trans isomerase SurA
MKKIVLAVAFCIISTIAWCQPHVIDKVVAIVGNEMVMYSDVQAALLQFKDLTPDQRKDAICYITDQLMQKKLLLSRAKIDSLKVTDEQVETEMDKRMNFFVEQYGSVENLERANGKTIVQIKNELHDNIKDQILIEQMQNKVVSDLDIGPADVRKFFNSVDADSLPYYNTEMEIGQIVRYPAVSQGERQRVIDELRQVRKDVLSGKAKFATKAIILSKDIGTRNKGGEMDMQRADNFVPEFAAAALALKKDSISDVVETKYGFHLIQMIERKGDMIHVRHILLTPEVSYEAKESVKEQLDSIRKQILADTAFTFEKAVAKYSQDEETKNRGGLLVDMKTNSSRIPVDGLDADVFFTVDKLKTGEISEPVEFTTPEQKEAYRILWLKAKTLPHRADLATDYPKIKQIALEYKKQEKMDEWFKKYIKKTYIHIDPEYAGCERLQKW